MKKLNLEEKNVSEILDESALADNFGSGSGSGSGSKGSGSGSGSHSAPKPSGTLQSNGQEEVGTSFFAPYGTSMVRFSCIANAAPTPVFTCQTKALGGWNSKTGLGHLGGVTVIDVPIDASNYNVSIKFQTTDSNGGKCSWQAI